MATKNLKQKNLTKEEELLLQDFSRNVSTKSSALFYGNALIVSAIPICGLLYTGIGNYSIPPNIDVFPFDMHMKVHFDPMAAQTCEVKVQMKVRPVYSYTVHIFCTMLGLFWRIHQMDLYQSSIVFAIGTIISTYLVSFAYKNVKFVLKHKVAQKREEAVSREVMKKLADDKKMNKKEKDERILWKKNEVADYEATTFAIFYNNALYLVLLIIASFYVLRNFNPNINYIFSVGTACGLLALFSTSTK